MKIGIFDSGLGGLIITKAIIQTLPKYDYIYLGDTKRVPYGNRPQNEILNFTKQALVHLFKQDCKLVIIACNTSSAKALRKIQQEFLPKFYPDRKVLGVIVPTLEAIDGGVQKVGVIATKSTANSHAYKKQLAKMYPKITVYEQAAPKLVRLIEGNELSSADAVLRQYLKPLLAKKIGALILGCTHYPILKNQIQRIVGRGVRVISQDEIIPGKLADYLKRHKEIDVSISKTGKKIFQVTKLTNSYQKVALTLFGTKLNIKLVKY
jgi:glutamate racemase